MPVALSAGMASPPVACVNCAALTVMAELVLAVLVPSLTSVLVAVKVPVAGVPYGQAVLWKQPLEIDTLDGFASGETTSFATDA